ncbi:hypothetical protein [Vitreimonas flagellata]|uniref:hypothetical protein n=1 Tax=Vitreimonas flagellata TaxID=2560861 RepID=UPI001EF7DF33|nr:hypothetical protein [Vitreimonas flagellata]
MTVDVVKLRLSHGRLPQQRLSPASPHQRQANARQHLTHIPQACARRYQARLTEEGAKHRLIEVEFWIYGEQILGIARKDGELTGVEHVERAGAAGITQEVQLIAAVVMQNSAIAAPIVLNQKCAAAFGQLPGVSGRY